MQSFTASSALAAALLQPQAPESEFPVITPTSILSSTIYALHDKNVINLVLHARTRFTAFTDPG